MKKVCQEVYVQTDKADRHCALDHYHVGCCQDETGFMFIVEHFPLGYKTYWPDHMGNGPSGYPMNDKAFDKAVKQSLDDSKEDFDKAEKFLEALGRGMRSQH